MNMRSLRATSRKAAYIMFNEAMEKYEAPTAPELISDAEHEIYRRIEADPRLSKEEKGFISENIEELFRSYKTALNDMYLGYA